MKKIYLILAAAAGMTVASCTSDEYVGTNNPYGETAANDGSIRFGGGFKAVTRADHVGADAAAMLNNKFIVGGFKGDGSTMTQVFDNYIVQWGANTAGKTTSNTSDWEYVNTVAAPPSKITGKQTIKYWDYSANQYDFAAYSTGDLTVATSLEAAPGKVVVSGIYKESTYAGPKFVIKGFAEDLAKCYISDLVTAYNPADYQKEVQLKFRNLATKVRVALYETIPGYSVKSVKFYTDNATTLTTGASATSATLFAPNTGAADVFYTKGTATISYPTIGSSNIGNTDYNKAHVSFAPLASGGSSETQAFGGLNYTTKDDREAAGSYLARNSNNPTFAGNKDNNYYINVIPNETGTVLELRVDYTLVSTDGSGEEINIHGATAYVPKIYATWKSNYAYTYIFKISDNTNGWTSTVDTDPAGLFPITFDAIVVDAEENEQTTITTVATPSITTYQPGHDYDAQETYKAGNIYVQVMTGTTLEGNLGTKGKLYTISDANATEAQVMDALSIQESATGDPLVITGRNGLTLTDVSASVSTNIASIPGVDGNNITPITSGTAAMFTGAANTTYAYTFDTGTYAGVYLASEPADWSSYYKDNECTTVVEAWTSAGTFYKRTTFIGSYDEYTTVPAGWDSSDNIYYSDAACTKALNKTFASLHTFVLDAEPGDWASGDYYTNTECTTPAGAYTDGTYYKKVKCYRKYTVDNKIYGVKVIKVASGS